MEVRGVTGVTAQGSGDQEDMTNPSFQSLAPGNTPDSQLIPLAPGRSPCSGLSCPSHQAVWESGVKGTTRKTLGHPDSQELASLASSSAHSSPGQSPWSCLRPVGPTSLGLFVTSVCALAPPPRLAESSTRCVPVRLTAWETRKAA